MKQIILCLFFYISSSVISISYGKDCEVYKINYNSVNLNQADFELALNKLDLERFRPYYADYIMKFNNGVEVTLYAAHTMINKNCGDATKTDYPSLEYLQKNIQSFQYNERQKTIMALFNINKSK